MTPSATAGCSALQCNPGYTYWADFIFQAMFAATAATIVSGSLSPSGSLSCLAFLIFSTTVLVGCFRLPNRRFLALGRQAGWAAVNRRWRRWLQGLRWICTVVHAFGGFAALACVIVLGPRKGKYTKNGSEAHPCHPTYPSPQSAPSCSSSDGSDSTAVPSCQLTPGCDHLVL